jgi:hypothetical protein
MGNLIWSDWGRLVALTAGYCKHSAIPFRLINLRKDSFRFLTNYFVPGNSWGALWAIFYRKYFWDFVGGKLGPVGIMLVTFLVIRFVFRDLSLTVRLIMTNPLVSSWFKTFKSTRVCRTVHPIHRHDSSDSSGLFRTWTSRPAQFPNTFMLNKSVLPLVVALWLTYRGIRVASVPWNVSLSKPCF